MNTRGFDQDIWDRVFAAVEKVRLRLVRAVSALEANGVPYAVTGGHAVAAWVSRVDDAAVRVTPGIDILIRREHLAKAQETLEGAGFFYQVTNGNVVFLDHENAKTRDAVHVIVANEKFRPDHLFAMPDVAESIVADKFRVLDLEPLVCMKLMTHRRKDRVHVRDMIDVGLVDETWLERVPLELRARLQVLLDTPDG